MATDLTNVAVSTGYVQLLHIDGGVGGSATRVYDGDGTGTPIEISTTEVVIKDGSFNLNVASHDGTNGLKLGGTLVTTSAAELNLLDGITAGTVSASKFLLVDSNKDLSGLRNLTATGTIQAANFTGTGNTQIGDAVADTVAMNATITTNLVFEGSTANAYETTLAITDPTADRTWTIPDATDTSVGRATTDTLTNKTLTAPDINTPDIDGGTVDAITSLTVANNVDIGSYDLRAGTLTADGLTSGRVVFASTNGVLSDDSDLSFSGATLSATNLTSSGTVTYGSLSDGSITITAFVDEDGMDSDSATLVPTQQSVKAYVDAQVTAQDLDLTTDSGTIAIDLDSETLTLTGGGGIDTSATSNTVTFSVDLNELATEISIEDEDFIVMVDATDSVSNKITFENLQDAVFNNINGDINIAENGTATIQANSVALATDTTGDYVQNITAGTGLTSTGATSGENIAHSLSVDANQAQVTAVGTLNSGAISSGFGAIDIGSSNLTATGTVSLGATSFSGAIDFNSQNMAEVDIDSGTIDGATIATSDITVGSGKTLDVSAGTLTLAANQISGDKVEGGTIAATTISSLTTAAITASANIDIGAYDFRAATLTADGLTAGRVVFAGTNGVLSDDSDLTFSGSTLTATNVIVGGTLTTTGTVQEVSTTNLNVEDPLILLNKYDSQPINNAYDAGFIIKRGSLDSAPANVGMVWDESTNQFALIDTSEDGTTAGNVSITDYENLRIGALTADDASTFTSTISAATGSTIGNLTLANGSITDSSGAISFGDENLTTTGTFSAEHLTSTDDATITDTISIDGTMTIATGSITDSSGAIDFGNENLSTSGTLSAGAITGTSFVIGSADIAEAELEMIDGITAGTAAASKAVVLDSSKNIATLGTIGSGAITATGTSSFATAIQTPLIEYTDGDDAITIADGGGITAAAGITSTAASNSFGATAFSGVVDITDVTDSSDATGDTGALRTEGGASIAKKLYVGTDLDVDGTANLDVVDIDGDANFAGQLKIDTTERYFTKWESSYGTARDYWWRNDSGLLQLGEGAEGDAQVKYTFDTANGRLGIGATAPSIGFIDVRGTGASTDLNTATILNLKQEATSTTANLRFNTATGNSAGHIIFNTDGSFQIRTDANNLTTFANNGNVGIGTTNPSYKLDVEESSAGTFPASVVHSDGTTPRGLRITFSGGNSFGNTNDYAIFFEDDTAAHFYVSGDGSVQNVSGTYGSALSDERLKENIVDATGKLDDLLKLKVKNFTFTNDSTETKHIGFIAQEFEQVFPSLVTERDDSEHSGITDLKGLQVGMEFAILVKAIQELSTQNDALVARIEALESA